jgi:hypothetical protein
MARSKSLCAKVCEKVCAELTAHLQSAAGIEKGLSGLVVFIQRFGSAANLNIHFHVIALDGVYEKKSTGRLKFYAAQAASVAHRIAFGPNAGQPVRRLKTQTSLWPSEQNFKSNSTACVSAGGYSVSRKGTSCGRMLKLRLNLMNANGSKNSCVTWHALPSRMNGSSSKGRNLFESN